MAWISPTPLDYFAALVADDDQFPLTEAVASLAQDAEPGLDVQAVLDQFDVLGRALQQRVGGAVDPIERVRQLHRYLYRELGLAGNVNHFHSPANSYLHEVLRSRRGIPISLAVIYLELAGQIGLPARGVSFPGHFLLRLDLPRGAALIDPLNGESLTREELVERAEPYLARASEDDGAWGLEGAGLPDDHLAALIQPATPREIVARMLRNLETLHRREGDAPALLQVLHRLVLLQPEDWHWRRERAGVLERLGEAQAAISDLEFVLRHAPAGRVRSDARERLEALRAAGGPRIF